MDNRVRELAKFAQRQSGEVRDNGSYGILDGAVAKRSYGEVTYQGDRIKVIDGMVFKNGHYEGRAS